MKTDVQTIIQTAELPPIPAVLQQILALADNPRTTSTMLEEIVVKEPALVTQILKWVNSAFYSLPKRISAVSHAMVLLGFSTVKSIASGMILINAFEEADGIKKDLVRQVWTHTLSDANVLKVLARSESPAVKDDLFLAGMIHDVGYLILSSYFGTKYDPLIAGGDFPTCETEQKLLGIDHPEIGAALLTEWKFPEQVIDMVRLHHKPEEYEGDPKNLAYLRVADAIGYEVDVEDFLSQSIDTVKPEFLADLSVIGWDWDGLVKEKEPIIQSVNMIRQLF